MEDYKIWKLKDVTGKKHIGYLKSMHPNQKEKKMIHFEDSQIKGEVHFIDGPSGGKKIALPTYPHMYYVPILDKDKNYNLRQREAVYIRHTAILPCGLWEYYYKFDRFEER